MKDKTIREPENKDNIREEIEEIVHYLTDDSDILSSGIRGTVDRLVELVSTHSKALIQDLIKELPDGCKECDYKGYTETGGMAMEDDLVEKEPCDYCSETLTDITSILNNKLKEQ